MGDVHPRGDPPELTRCPDGSWAIEQVDVDGEGGVAITIFHGPFGQWRARQYLRFVNPADWSAAEVPPPTTSLDDRSETEKGTGE